jgi:hypothetical protein
MARIQGHTIINSLQAEKRPVRNALANKLILFYCLAASLPAMLLAIIFNYAMVYDDAFIPGTNLRVLGYLIQAEFLAAASGILLIVPLLIQVRTRAMRLFRLAVFLAFGFGTMWVAYDIGGLEGMVSYVLLVFVTYGGGTLFVFDWLSGISRTFLSLLRWSMSIFLYVSFQLQFNLDADIESWKETDAVIPFGATFFYTLFALEIVLYPILTYYLERKLTQDRELQRAANQH